MHKVGGWVSELSPHWPANNSTPICFCGCGQRDRRRPKIHPHTSMRTLNDYENSLGNWFIRHVDSSPVHILPAVPVWRTGLWLTTNGIRWQTSLLMTVLGERNWVSWVLCMCRYGLDGHSVHPRRLFLRHVLNILTWSIRTLRPWTCA